MGFQSVTTDLAIWLALLLITLKTKWLQKCSMVFIWTSCPMTKMFTELYLKPHLLQTLQLFTPHQPKPNFHWKFQCHNWHFLLVYIAQGHYVFLYFVDLSTGSFEHNKSQFNCQLISGDTELLIYANRHYWNRISNRWTYKKTLVMKWSKWFKGESDLWKWLFWKVIL